jgi:tetratricopeptide (TPR) repeat protein
VTRLRAVMLPLFLVACGTGIYALATVLSYERYAGDVREEMMYFPSGRLLEAASAGYETLAADLLWLKGIQYYGEHRRGDMEYHLAEHIFDTITDLDPEFVGAYRFGAFVLAQDAGLPKAGADLLKKGMRHNPRLWQMPFDLGFLYFITVKDNAKAARYFEIASRFEGAPDITKRFSAFAYRKAGRNDAALSLWSEIYESSSNEVIRETALHAIDNITTEAVADTLTGIVNDFMAARGRYPRDLAELVSTGHIRKIPEEPFGGRYFFDQDSGRVLSTTQVSREAERWLGTLKKNLDRYFDRKGSYPAELGDLVAEGFLGELPSIPGAAVRYDPNRGEVEYALNRKE